MAGGLDGVERGERRVVLELDRDEEAVLPVRGGGPERLPVDRDEPLVVLAGRLGEELLEPLAEGRDLLGDDERDLVAATEREAAEERAERERRILADRHRVGAGFYHLACPLEQPVDVDADQRGRHEADERQRGEATADARVVQKCPAEAGVLGELLERAAGVGDRDEVLAGLRRLARLDLGPEELVERQDLGRRAGLRRHDEEGPRELEAGERVLDRERIRGVEHRQVGEPHLGPEGAVHHLGRQARPPHAEQQDVREAKAADLRRE